MTSPFNLKGKLALVTGSTQGIGLAIAVGLAESGAKVIINGFDREQCEKVAAQLRREQQIDVVAVDFDVSKSHEIRRAVARIEKEIGPIDILVNNAGVQLKHPFLEFPEEDLDKMIGVNQKAIFVVSQEVARYMKERKRGKIIHIGSMQCEITDNNLTGYAMTKGSVTMLTKGMCVELARYNIQVNGIGPGWFDTAILANFLKNEGCRKWLCERTPAGRWGQPKDLAGAAVFLASAASDFVNGHMLYVDGGFLAKV